MWQKPVKGYNTMRGGLNIDPNNQSQSFLINRLKGQKAGAHLQFEEKFPADYEDTRLAGKTVHFDVKVIESYHFVKLPFGEELAKELENESLEEWKVKVEKDAQTHYGHFSNLCKRRSLLDALSEKHPFDVPDILEKREFDAIWAQLEEEERSGGSEGKTAEEVQQECQKLANRRVRLGFVVTHLGEALNVKVYQGDLEQAMWREAIRLYSQFGGESHRVVSDYYKNNPAAYNQLVSGILEEKVISALLERVTLKPVEISLEQLKEKVDGILPDFWEDFNQDSNQEECEHHEGCGHQH